MGEFGVVDYIVVGATLLVSLLIGIYFALVANKKTSDLLVGGRNMGVLPIAASMLVTYLSAITVIGTPAEIYAFGIQIFTNTIIYIIFVPISCYLFMNVFFHMKFTSVYEYLELRFESVFVRWFGSLIFVVQMTFFSALVLYAPSLALRSFIGLELWHCIVGLGLCSTIYTAFGGLKAVVWTDVFQLIMVLLGLFAIIIQGFISGGGVSNTFQKAHEHGRLDLFDFTIDFFMRHNTLNMFLGHGFTIICLYGTHQPQVQRYSSLPSISHARKAIVFSMPLSLITVGLCILAGIVIFGTYAGCDPIQLNKIQVADQIVPYFVKDQLHFIPGMMGLFTACVFSASLSTLSSAFNSMAAVVWEDFLLRIPYMVELSEKRQANVVRITALTFGFLTMGLAFIAQHMGSILSATQYNFTIN